MSIKFSDTTNKNGIIQHIEKECGLNDGDISGNSTKLLQVTGLVNLAWDDYLAIALPASGKWQYDDSNHSSHPIITTNLVDGQRDYAITTDGTNLVLDIMKVAILPSATATQYVEISPIDAQSEDAGANLVANVTTEGQPFQYDKTGNSIFLDPIPSYNATSGLRLYVNREPSYFTSADTTKKPGCPGIHHTYFVLKAAYLYARRNLLTTTERLFRDLLRMEEDIKAYYGKRSKDERAIMTPKKIQYI